MKFNDLKSKINLNSGSKKAFLVKFLIISTVLFLIYLLIANFLFSVTLSVANMIMAVFGYKYELTLESGGNLSDVLINLNILAYISLILATPKIGRIRENTTYFLIFGSIFMFLVNTVFIASDTILSYSQGEPFIPYLSVMFFGTFGQVFFPFVLWFVMVHEWLFKDFNIR